MPPSPVDHLLLAPLGESPGAVLGMVDWLNAREHWPSRDDPTVAELPPITRLWVITTARDEIVATLEDELIPALRTFELRECRFLVVDRVDDSLTAGQHRAMAEVIYRLALQAGAWRLRDKDGRCFSASVAGGRKTMAALVQQAAVFFGADHVLHLNHTGDPRDAPRKLGEIRSSYGTLHPVRLNTVPHDWRFWLDALWAGQFPDLPLEPESFGLSDGWTPDAEPGRHGPTNVVPTAAPSGTIETLADSLEKIAGDSQRFARQALAGGVGASFLKHDLRKLVDRLSYEAGHAAGAGMPPLLPRGLSALSRYVKGLARVIDRSYVDPSWCIPIRDPSGRGEDLVRLCDDALILALGEPAERIDDHPPVWLKKEKLRLTLVLPDGAETLAIAGLRSGALLLVLRNLIVNVRDHGSAAELWREPHGELKFERQEDRVRLEASNRVSPERLESLTAMARQGGLGQLLRPFRRFEPTSSTEVDPMGRGLGLFTLAEVARGSDGAMSLDPPRIEPRGDELRFVVRLSLSIEPR